MGFDLCDRSFELDQLVFHLRATQMVMLQIELPPQLLPRQLVDHPAQLVLVLHRGRDHARENGVIVILHHWSVGSHSRRRSSAFGSMSGVQLSPEMTAVSTP